MLDARAQILAQVGGVSVPVISGETSDDFLMMSGLISTTGRLSVAGLHPAAIGTAVDLAWVAGSYVGRLPRPRLRVLRCTVDPLRRQTDYELGDLFALRSGLKATDPFGLVSPTSTTQQTYDADALVRQAIAQALGSDPGPTGITGTVWGDFDWKNGYLAGAAQVLLSFRRFAYLTPDETVAFGSLDSPPLSGAEVDLKKLVDLRPLTGGSRPGAVAVGAGQIRILNTGANGGGGASGSTSTRAAVLSIPSINWSVGMQKVTRAGGEEWVVVSSYDQQQEDVIYQVSSTTSTSSDGASSVTITTTTDLVGAIGTGYISEIPNYVYNSWIAETQRRVDALNQKVVDEGAGALATRTGTRDTLDLPSPTNTKLDQVRPDLVAVVPDQPPTATVIRSREESSEYRAPDGTGTSVRKSYITRYEADLALAASRQQQQGTGALNIINSGLQCDFLASESRTVTSKAGDLFLTRTTNWDFRSGISTTVQWSRSGTVTNTSEPDSSTYTTQLYRAQVAQVTEGYLDAEAVYVCPCTIVENPEAAIAAFGAVQNRLAYGYRHGVQLQSVLGVLPTTPGASFHLTTDGQTGTFRVNGLSVAFDASQCLLSMDALYWGASA